MGVFPLFIVFLYNGTIFVYSNKVYYLIWIVLTIQMYIKYIHLTKKKTKNLNYKS